MLTDLQLLTMTIALGVFFCGLLWIADKQAKEERGKKQDNRDNNG